MQKRIEIEVRKKEDDRKVALDRKREEDMKHERMRVNLEKIMKVVGEENKIVKEKREREIIKAQKWRDEKEERMEARRLKEDRERQEKYEKEIEDLPPLEPLEDLVEDGQVPGTSGTSTITRTIFRTPSWEREELDEWDESGWEETIRSIPPRPEFGEDDGGKGKEGKGEARKWKKGEVVKFGTVMSKKEHKLLDSRCAVLRAIAEGLEVAKKGDVEPEDREFF